MQEFLAALNLVAFCCCLLYVQQKTSGIISVTVVTASRNGSNYWYPYTLCFFQICFLFVLIGWVQLFTTNISLSFWTVTSMFQGWPHLIYYGTVCISLVAVASWMLNLFLVKCVINYAVNFSICLFLIFHRTVIYDVGFSHC